MNTASGALPPPSAFVLDLDGTALTSSGTFSDATKAAVKDALDDGVPVVIATGRDESQALAYADQLGLTADAERTGAPAWVINSLGAVATDATHRNDGFAQTIPADDAQAILDYAHDRGYPASLTTEHEQYWDRPAADPHLQHLLDTMPQRDDLRPLAPHATIIRIHGGNGAAADVAAHFAGTGDRVAMATDTSMGGAELSMTARGVDKGYALRRLFAQAHIDPRGAYEFGDSGVDLPGFAAVGVPVAMGNATPKVKAAAQIVTGTNDADGVATTMEAALAQRTRA